MPHETPYVTSVLYGLISDVIDVAERNIAFCGKGDSREINNSFLEQTK
jgi:hypothetical protein